MFWLVVAAAGLVALTACGGGSSMNPSGGMVAAQMTPVSMNIGDAPADNLLALEVTISSVTLMKSDNSTVTVLNTPVEIEVTHLAGTTEPLVLSQVPQGTYNSATVTVTKVEVTFLNGGVPVEKEITMNTPVTVTFSPALTVGMSPMVVTLDLNAANSVTISGSNVTVNPQFTVSSASVPPGEQEPEDGEVDNVVGRVTAVDTTKGTFTIQLGESGNSFTFMTSNSTKFEVNDGNASLGALVVGMLVKVEGSTQSDGTLLATEVQAKGPGGGAGVEVEGLVTRIDASAPTMPFTFDVVVQDGNGQGMAANFVGQIATVNVDSSTQFNVDPGKLDVSAFTFDAAHLSKGQRVEADSDGDMSPMMGMAGNIAAKTVALRKQTLSGTIASLAADQSSFVLQLNPASAFTKLSGATQVMVLKQANTQLKNIMLSNGASVRVRGFVSFDGTNFTVVAARIVPPEH